MRFCVFLGSSAGKLDAYREAAIAVGNALVDEGIGLVYGGGTPGLMGFVSGAVRSRGGEVIGVIPRSLFEREAPDTDISDIRFVESMHERKATMADLADAFLALPGGIGTLEELFEVWTWAQLDYHRKPCGLLNVNSFYDKLLQFMDGVVDEGFLQPKHKEILQVDSNALKLIRKMKSRVVSGAGSEFLSHLT